MQNHTSAASTALSAGLTESDVDPSFRYINIAEFNAACDRFLRARVPGYAARQDAFIDGIATRKAQQRARAAKQQQQS